MRIRFYLGHYEDERIQDVVEFCVKYGFKNVMLFINAEEYNVGHMTVEEAKPWVKTMKKARAVLQEKGISVSRKSGRKLPVRYETKGNSVSIQSKNGHLSTQTFILTEDGNGH